MSAIPAELEALRDELKAGREARPVAARDLLRWFNSSRRSPWINTYVRAALSDVSLRTEPDFESANLDEPLRFFQAEPQSAFASQTATAKRTSETRPEPLATSGEDPTLRIRVVDAAVREPTVVPPDAPISRATTLMVSKDFSQLPVVSNRSVRGAISWKSLGKRLALGSKPTVVADCMERPTELRVDTPLLDAIDVISKNDYALIRDESGRLIGLVTTADLSITYKLLSRPFLLLREAENYIRNILNERLTIDEIVMMRDPSVTREVKSAADLSMGEYLRGLTRDDVWSKLSLHVDRKDFVRHLDDARLIRNDVMHFDPDPIEPERLGRLEEFVRLLQALGSSGLTGI